MAPQRVKTVENEKNAQSVRTVMRIAPDVDAVVPDVVAAVAAVDDVIVTVAATAIGLSKFSRGYSVERNVISSTKKLVDHSASFFYEGVSKRTLYFAPRYPSSQKSRTRTLSVRV